MAPLFYGFAILTLVSLLLPAAVVEAGTLPHKDPNHNITAKKATKGPTHSINSNGIAKASVPKAVPLPSKDRNHNITAKATQKGHDSTNSKGSVKAKSMPMSNSNYYSKPKSQPSSYYSKPQSQSPSYYSYPQSKSSGYYSSPPSSGYTNSQSQPSSYYSNPQSQTQSQPQSQSQSMQYSTPQSHPGPMESYSTAPSSNPTVQAFVEEHNKIRNTYGAPPLSWNPQLVPAAQQLADACAFRHTQNNPHGENIAAGQMSPREVVTEWVEGPTEKCMYDPHNPIYSHFTQVVWHSTTQVGCAVANCPTMAGLSLPQSPIQFWVCEYSPAGNVASMFTQNVHANAGGTPAPPRY